jgi:hypothetical protein
VCDGLGVRHATRTVAGRDRPLPLLNILEGELAERLALEFGQDVELDQVLVLGERGRLYVEQLAPDIDPLFEEQLLA